MNPDKFLQFFLRNHWLREHEDSYYDARLPYRAPRRRIEGRYDAEEQLIKALPKLSQAASNEEVSEHSTFTPSKPASTLLDSNIFERFPEKPKAKKCEGMKGIIAEEETLLPEEPTSRPDCARCRLDRLCPACGTLRSSDYGTLQSYARTLGANEAAKLLQTVDVET